MTRVEPGQRKRVKAPKVRTGCKTCSATASLKALIGVVRRIKCGEERPACIKCTSTGRICDGYSGLGIEPWTQPDLMPAWEATIAPTPFRGKESRSLLFFRERTVHQLNSFFPNHFWSDIVPQIAQTEPSVRHALVAFSGFHERFVRGSIPVDEHFGFKQYNLAIRQLLECRSSQISQLIGLLCCLLFVSIELLQNKLTSATILLKSGKKILNQLQKARWRLISDSNTSSQELFASLERHFMRLDFQVTSIHSVVDKDVHFTPSKLRIPTPCPPVTVLSSLVEAQQRYEQISQAWVRHVWSGHCDHALFSERLRQWNVAFQDLLRKQKHSFDVRDRRGVALLELHRRQFELALMFVPLSPNDFPMWWDTRVSTFEEMVHYAAATLDLSDELDTLSPCFSLDAGINAHLYTVALRCRDPVIRRRAIALMRSANRSEGFWRGDVVALVAERIVTLEEQGLNVQSCQDIPEEARLRSIRVFLDAADMKANICLAARDKVFEEVLSWQESALHRSREL